jgi:hypothetical protein
MLKNSTAGPAGGWKLPEKKPKTRRTEALRKKLA